MKKKIVLVALFLSLLSSKSYSQLITMDMTNLPQNILTAMNTANQISEMVKQYQNMIQQYELMVKDMAQPLMWIWKQVDHFEKNSALYKQKFSAYNDQAAWENYLKDYLDLSSFDRNKCFNGQGCTAREKKKLEDDRKFFIEHAAKVSKNVVTDLSNFAKDYDRSVKQLKLIQKEAERAEGNVQSQAVLAQYLQAANENLISLRKEIVSIQEQMVAMNNIKLNEKAIQEAQFNVKYDVKFREPDLLFGR